MNRSNTILVASIAVVALGAVSYAAYDYSRPAPVAATQISATSTSKVLDPETSREYGSITLRIGETAVYKGLRITPRAVTEDSRCPSDVQCIWAGTARISLEVVSGLGTSTTALELGKSMTTEAEVITFTNIAPGTKGGEEIADGSYRITLDVEKRVAAQKPGACFVGGCSSQLCSDRPDMVSTCEYRDSYACYQGASCARQASGECGWTPTPALAACLIAAG